VQMDRATWDMRKADIIARIEQVREAIQSEKA